MIPPPPRSTLFPYTTLFRSVVADPAQKRLEGVIVGVHRARQHRAATEVEHRLFDGNSIDRTYPGDRPAIDPDRRTLHRSEEHTSELQSLRHLVCRLLLEKKK